MSITHRTEIADQRARNITPVPVCLPDLPRGTEEWLAAKMLDDAKDSPKFTQHGNVGQCRRENTEERILAVLTRRMTAPQIANLVDMSDEAIRRNMSRMHLEGKVRREGPRNSRIWSKA